MKLSDRIMLALVMAPILYLVAYTFYLEFGSASQWMTYTH